MMEEEEIQENLAALNARLAAAETENRLYRIAPGMGVSPKAVPYLARLCPSAGEDDDAVRDALEKVLEDLPGLRTAPDPAPRSGFRIGAGAIPARNDNDMLRAAFGL